MLYKNRFCKRSRRLVVLMAGVAVLAWTSEALAQGRNVSRAAKGVAGDASFQTLKAQMEINDNSFDSRIINLNEDVEKLELDIQDVSIQVTNLEKNVTNLEKNVNNLEVNVNKLTTRINTLTRQITRFINNYRIGGSSSSGGGSSSGGSSSGGSSSGGSSSGSSSSGGPPTEPIIHGGNCPRGQVMVGLQRTGARMLTPRCAEIASAVGAMECPDDKVMAGITKDGDPICRDGSLSTEAAYCSAKELGTPLAICKSWRSYSLPQKAEGSVHRIGNRSGTATYLCTSSGEWVQMTVFCSTFEHGGGGGEGGK